jgi:cell division protein ZapA
MGRHSIQVVINKKVYQLSGAESEEYLQKLARYIDRKMQELAEASGYDKMTSEYQNLLLALNLADDYFKCRDEVEHMDKEAADRDRQLFEMKHELIDRKIQCESLERMVNEYKKQITELQKEVIRLEQRITDES